MSEAESGKQRDLVRRGYDAISNAYRSDAGEPGALTEATTEYASWLGELAESLSPAARVLDLGCGAGVPASRILVDLGFEVTGVDISEVQIRRASALVPQATFIQADFVEWDCDPGSFDAVVCLYTLIHVPLSDQRPLLAKVTKWLRPGGRFLVIVGHARWTGTEDYLGAEMFWDHADTDTYLAWLLEAGLRPEWHRFIPEGDGGHTLILAVR